MLIAKLFIGVMILCNVGQAQDNIVYHRDATQSKALIDTYLSAFEADDETQIYWQQKQIITYLFEAYDRQVYTATLHYLHSFENTHPDAVLALSDSLQAYWDSNYLQSYLVGSAAEYGKLKFLATLGIVGGGLGLLKNPLASFATIKGFNFLLPLAGGVGAYYAVEFFRQPLPDVPLEPQQVLSFASGERYFSYAQKRNDYLYRLFGVGIGLGSGEFIFKALVGIGNSIKGQAKRRAKVQARVIPKQVELLMLGKATWQEKAVSMLTMQQKELAGKATRCSSLSLSFLILPVPQVRYWVSICYTKAHIVCCTKWSCAKLKANCRRLAKISTPHATTVTSKH